MMKICLLAALCAVQSRSVRSEPSRENPSAPTVDGEVPSERRAQDPDNEVPADRIVEREGDPDDEVYRGGETDKEVCRKAHGLFHSKTKECDMTRANDAKDCIKNGGKWRHAKQTCKEGNTAKQAALAAKAIEKAKCLTANGKWVGGNLKGRCKQAPVKPTISPQKAAAIKKCTSDGGKWLNRKGTCKTKQGKKPATTTPAQTTPSVAAQPDDTTPAQTPPSVAAQPDDGEEQCLQNGGRWIRRKQKCKMD